MQRKMFFKSWTYIVLYAIFMLGSCTEKESAQHTITGIVTDELDSPIPNVSVVLQSQSSAFTAETDNRGRYQFKNLSLGKYAISFSKSGFKDTTQTTEIIFGKNVNKDCCLKNNMGVVTGGTASISIIDSLAISDGIYSWLKIEGNAQKYYAKMYIFDNIANWSDIEIAAKLIANGTMWSYSINNLYNYNLIPNTNYTHCLVAIDAQGRVQSLTKKTIKTKSPNSQPLADINITSIGGGNMSCNIIKNHYCSSYSYSCTHTYSNAASILDKPDIYWAALAYLQRKVSDNTSLNFVALQGYVILVTLGFDAEGNNSGIISKKVFDSNGGGSIIF